MEPLNKGFYQLTYYKHEREILKYKDGQAIFIPYDKFLNKSL